MSKPVLIKTTHQTELVEFLETHDYLVETVKPALLRVQRDDLEVFVSVGERELFFEVDAGAVDALASKEFYQALLTLNTEILPVSLGLDATSSSGLRVVLLESRESKNLDDNEILAVFEAFEIAYRKLEHLLNKFIKTNR